MKLEGLIKLPIMIVGSVVVLTVLVILGGLSLVLTASEKQAVPADRAAVYTTDDVLRAYPAATFDPSGESWEILRYIDGEWEILYTYDGTQHDWPLFITTMTSVAVSKKEAHDTYVIMQGVTSLIGDGIDAREADHILTVGERHACSILIDEDGTEIGNSCLVLDENRVVDWTISGIVFTDPGSADEALGPVLERLRAYDPGDIAR